jgi:hypothetical protein
MQKYSDTQSDTHHFGQTDTTLFWSNGKFIGSN